MSIFKNINDPKIMLVVGACGSGKSSFMRFFLKHIIENKGASYGYIFTGSGQNDDFTKMIPSGHIINNYSQNKVAEILGYQSKNTDKHCFIVFDDLLGSIDFGSNFITALITRHRHFNVSLFFTSQYLIKVPPVFREIANNVLIFKQTSKRGLQNLYENFCEASFDSFLDFKKWYSGIDSNELYFGLLIDNKEQDTEKRYMKYKAPYLDKKNDKILNFKY